jgi:nucleotide-binding universal stress UspA family protein
VNGTTRDHAVLVTALHVGRFFNAHLHCLHVVPDFGSLVARATNVDLTSAMLLTDAVRTLEAEAEKRAAHARKVFLAFCAEEHLARLDVPHDPASVNAAWHEPVGKPVNVLMGEARFHDFIVVEGGAKHDLMLSKDDVGRLIVGAGRAILLVPPAPHNGSLKSIAIAWKNCPEAARAVTAAMPLLTKAEKIVVLSAEENGNESEACAESLDNLTNYLRWHGLRAERLRVDPGTHAIPDAILKTAFESGLDLLVMGGFGHSRLREFVFGGFTQRVLDGTALPVLLFH